MSGGEGASEHRTRRHPFVFSNPSTTTLLLVEGANLGEQRLSLGGVSSDWAESLGSEGLACSLGGGSPSENLLSVLGVLGTVGLLDGHNLSGLVALQVGLLQPTG